MEIKIEASWKEGLKAEFEKSYFIDLIAFVKEEYRKGVVYPPAKLLFNAFDRCSFENIKLVILGQDPYHGSGQAHGLCFSVPEGVTRPPSLLNIFKEQKRDLDIPIPTSGNLERWADQGVFMLNAILTVRAAEAASHQKKGWETFTDAVIKLICEQKQGIVFLLWGAYAQSKAILIDEQKHLVLRSVHPSPLSASRGFIGCGHFSKTNLYLKLQNKSEIIW